MKKQVKAVIWCTFLSLILLAWIAGWAVYSTRAQTVAPPITIQSTVAHASCVVPPVGTSAFCFAADGLWQSLNGAAYTQVGAAAAGVTSIAVNGGSPQTGAILLTIPTKATTTVTSTASTTIQ